MPPYRTIPSNEEPEIFKALTRNIVFLNKKLSPQNCFSSIKLRKNSIIARNTMPFSKLYLDIAEFDIRILYRIDYFCSGAGQGTGTGTGSISFMQVSNYTYP